MSKHEYLNGTKRIEYFVVRTRRSKTSEIIVDSDKIVIRVPYSKPDKEIESLIKEKISWIVTKQREILHGDKRVEISKPAYAKDSTLPYLGKNHKIQLKMLDSLKENNKEVVKNSVVHKNELFLFNIHSGIQEVQDLKNEVRRLYENWLYHKANIIFKEKVHKLSKVMGVKPNKVVIKNLNCWASIAKNNEMNLNVNLVKAPPEIIDYIIIHELCHFKVKGHSYNFWDLLRSYSPDYPKFIKWLDINGKNLLS